MQKKIRPYLCFGKAIAVLAVGCASVCAAEADWIYRTGELLERLETIDKSDVSAQTKKELYQILLQQGDQFVAAPQVTPRESHARRVVGQMMRSRINQRLGNDQLAKEAADEYRREKVALPSRERFLFTLLLEQSAAVSTQPVKTEASSPPPPPPAPPAGAVPGVPVCNVEVQDGRVRVTAVDYPIDAILRKIADTAGVKLSISKEVVGRGDYQSGRLGGLGWTLTDIAVPRGMDIADFSERGYEVIVIDPMFSASVGERADKRPKLPAIAPPKKGIDKGCAIVRGFYLPPPYEVTVEEQDGIIQACINGVPIYRAEPARLLAAARPPVALPADGQFTLSQRTDLKRYVSRIFKDVKLAKGAKAAAKAVEEFLRTQKSAVKNYEFGTDYDSLEIEWADGNADEILLYSVEAPLSATTKPDGPLLKLVLAEAEDIRKQAEKTLAAGGLILAPSRWSPKFFIGEEAKAKLQVILDGMSEIYRWRDIIQVGVFGGASERRWEAGWEVVLNLRYRELALHRK